MFVFISVQDQARQDVFGIIFRIGKGGYDDMSMGMMLTLGHGCDNGRDESEGCNKHRDDA